MMGVVEVLEKTLPWIRPFRLMDVEQMSFSMQ